MDAFFPDFVEVGLSIFSGFKFKLPVTAMGIDDPMIVEIVAEYGQSASNPEMLAAQAWAKELHGVTSGFITSVQVPMKPNESLSNQAERLFRALNESQNFHDNLVRYIHFLMERRK